MVREITKKVWPENFESLLNGKRGCDLRVNDFKVNEDDIMVFKEWDPEKKRYTGRSVRRVVKRVNELKPLDYYTATDLKKGLLVIELIDSVE